MPSLPDRHFNVRSPGPRATVTEHAIAKARQLAGGRPVLVFLYQEGCHFCAAQKALLHRFIPANPDIFVAMTDANGAVGSGIDTKFTPAYALAAPGREGYVTIDRGFPSLAALRTWIDRQVREG